MISSVKIASSGVEFVSEGQRYIYAPIRGRLYIGALGTPVHQSDAGSFEIFDSCTLNQIKLQAQLLGAQVYPAR